MKIKTILIDYTTTTQRLGSRHKLTGDKIQSCPKCGKRGTIAIHKSPKRIEGNITVTHKKEFRSGPVFPHYKILETCYIKKGETPCN